MLKFYLKFILIVGLFSCSNEVLERKKELKNTVEKLNSLKEERGFTSNADVRDFLIMTKPYIDKIINIEREIDDYYGRERRKAKEYLMFYNQNVIEDCCKGGTGFFGLDPNLGQMALRKYYISDEYKL